MEKPETCPVCQREIGKRQSRRAIVLLVLAGAGLVMVLQIAIKLLGHLI